MEKKEITGNQLAGVHPLAPCLHQPKGLLNPSLGLAGQAGESGLSGRVWETLTLDWESLTVSFGSKGRSGSSSPGKGEQET